MSIYSYQIFEIVSEEGSFAKAATVLRLTPSAVSHSIAKLEDDLGCQLFWRNRSGVVLTEEGKRLLPFIKKIQSSNEDLLQEASRIRNREVGLVRVGVFYSVAVNWLPAILESFKASYPDIEVEVHEGGYADISKWLYEHKIDIGFLTDRSAESLTYTFLKSDPLVYITPIEFKPKNDGHVTVDEIKEHEMMLQRECADYDALTFVEKHHIPISPVFNMNEDETVLSLTEKGLGYCMMPQLAAMHSKAEVNRYFIEPALSREIVLAEADSGQIPSAAAILKQHIIDFVATIKD